MAQPLLAQECRIYIYNLARRLRVPLKGAAGLAEGIEVFPRQDQLGPGEFGNAIRGPLGIHRGAGKRYWFYGADYDGDAQLRYLERLKKISEDEMRRFIQGMEMPEDTGLNRRSNRLPSIPTGASFAFSITFGRHAGALGIIGRGVRRAPAKAVIGAATISQSRYPIRASIAVGQDVLKK